MEVLIVRQHLEVSQALKVNRDMLTWLIDESARMNVPKEYFVDVLKSINSNLAIILDSFEEFINDSK